MNKYQVIDVIDQGAYGIVLKALNKQTGKYVAIKKFKEGDENEIVKKNIQRQIKMLKTLKSQYVVDLKEAFKRKGKVYLIFQYLQKNLLNLIEQNQNGLPPNVINNIVYQLFKGLKFLHSKDIIHRDIKPENLLISNSQSKLKICDFGFTRIVSNPNQQLTDYVATRWYRSPQLLVGQKYDAAIDIWAAGCIMGQLIDGQPMFPGQNQMDQLYLIKKGLGQLTVSQMEKFSKNQRFIGLKFPQIRKIQSLQSKYIGKASKQALSFLKCCLKIDPKQRITAANALNHPYLSLLNQSYISQEEQIKLLSSQKKSKRIGEMKTDVSPRGQVLPIIKTIYTKSRGFFNEQKQLKTKYEGNSLNPSNQYHYDKNIELKKQKKSQLQSIDRSSHEPFTVNMNVNMKVNLNVHKKQRILPKIKQKQHRLVHTKVASQPLMIQAKSNRIQNEESLRISTHYNTPLTFGILGQSKSIMKMKKT